ncbi:MAG: hypothetical protein RSA17_06400 [Ruthenibacterium sp.]
MYSNSRSAPREIGRCSNRDAKSADKEMSRSSRARTCAQILEPMMLSAAQQKKIGNSIDPAVAVEQAEVTSSNVHNKKRDRSDADGGMATASENEKNRTNPQSVNVEKTASRTLSEKLCEFFCASKLWRIAGSFFALAQAA